MAIFGQKWLYSKKSSCIRTKVVVFGQSGFIRINWYYSGKIVVFGQGGFNWAKVVEFGKSGCIRAKVVVIWQIVVFGQKWLYSDKLVVFGQNCLYSGKIFSIRTIMMHSGKNGCIRARRTDRRLNTIWQKAPFTAYRRGKNLKDRLVRARFR